jgi:signal transduction histidine kinase
LDFVYPEFREKVRRRIVTAPVHSKNPPVELMLLRTDEATVPVEMVSVHFRHRNVDLILAVARDISERKRMQDELVKAQRLESLGVLAGGIAHDFNNILTGILGNISLLLHQLGPSSDFADRLESCEKAAIRASELTQQLLTFARGGAPVRKLMDPRTLIRESAIFVLRGSQIGCEIELAEDLWSIKADAGQINQVLHNILINAMQAMSNGGVIGITGVNEQVSSGNLLHLPAGDYLRIDIKDQGCGISQEDLPKIFDPYFSTKSEGTGLGLASVYSVVKKHGGAIDVSSTVGTGSIFTIFLPAVSGERPAEIAAAGKNRLTGSGRILIMDDEQIIRDVATVILKSAGYQVESCNDGKEAVDRYRRRFETDTAFDVVIMDLTVPGGMGGKEAARLILEIDPNAVLIVSSGYSNDPVIANFRQYGFRGAVVKPFSVTTLVAEVRRLT